MIKEETRILYNAIVDLSEGNDVFEVIPDVPKNKIVQWEKYLLDEGFYVKLEFNDIYYASPSYIENNYGEYTTDGWSN